MCLYLSSEERVKNLTDEYQHIKINNFEIPINPLVRKQQKVIISNVAPPIPNYVIEALFDKLEIKRVAPITTLKATITKQGYFHVLSSRRQTFIKPDDIQKFPDLIKLDYNQTVYHIYPSTGELKCFKCKLDGHTARFCQTSESDQNNSQQSLFMLNSKQIDEVFPLLPKGNIDDKQTDHTSQTNDLSSFQTEGLSISPEMQLQSQVRNDLEISQEDFKIPKRALSQSTSSQSSQKKGESSSPPPKKIQKTHVRKMTIEKVESQLNSIKEKILENQHNYPLTYEHMVNFLYEVHGKSKALDISMEFTSDTIALLNMLDDIHTLTPDRNLKSRINRIKKRLSNDDNTCTSSEESTYSE